MSQHLQFPQPDQYPSLDLDLSPGSADSLAMAGLGRPRQAGMPPFVQYASLSAQGSGAGELAAGLQAFAAHTGQHGFVPSQGSHSMMRQFMHDPTSPWNPLIMSTEPIPGDSARRQAPGILLNPAYSTFGSFRSVAPPSEADTVSQSFPGIPTDSGYGSIAKPSVGNPSVYDGEVDQSVETQSLISRFNDMTPQDTESREASRKRQGRGQS
ncbi:f3a2b1b8-230c-4a98-a55f-19ea85ad1051 [Thermothielavioides terrestris]|uniref:F3a2b1b8-230c-4a98-a55f-19ea85ad1051 n=1 Tax=Thermothielavioides terrestris TaxID=2587410 RepID=A0A3S4BJU9_9PEZI|nr:f3a2b1b8-230c-4a98-a55f-19ea85ad1051 [Thermothielavioides terrestris]